MYNNPPDHARKTKLCKYYLLDCCRYSDQHCHFIHQREHDDHFQKIINLCEDFLGEENIKTLKKNYMIKKLSSRESVKKYNKKMLLQCIEKYYSIYSGKKYTLNAKKFKSISKTIKKTVTKTITNTIIIGRCPVVNEHGDVIDDGY